VGGVDAVAGCAGDAQCAGDQAKRLKKNDNGTKLYDPGLHVLDPNRGEFLMIHSTRDGNGWRYITKKLKRVVSYGAVKVRKAIIRR